MNTFKKWNGKVIEDWGSVMSEDGKKFYKAFKNFLKRSFPEAEVIGFKPNHYDASGFICKDGKYIYINHSIDRGRGYVDFSETGSFNGVLYRTAENDKDYKGGMNHFCNMYELVSAVNNLFERM